jgi:hypothetical protein
MITQPWRCQADNESPERAFPHDTILRNRQPFEAHQKAG